MVSDLSMDKDSILYRDLSPEEFRTLAFYSDLYTQGLVKDVSEETLQKYMASPLKYKKQLSKYMMYLYYSNGSVHNLFDMIKTLPSLEYKIKSLKVNAQSDKHTFECRKAMKEVNHKELTRDILMQLASMGTVLGLWCGRESSADKSTPYLILFNDFNFVFPGRRVKGKQRLWLDLAYLDSASWTIDEKIDKIENLAPYVTIDDYLVYKEKGEEYRYIELPEERTVCIRANTVNRGQKFGVPFGTSAIFDIKHKQKLRNLEQSVSNKIINALAVLTIGIDGSDTSTYKKLGEKLTRSVFQSVKTGLTNGGDDKKNMAVVGLPEWAKLEFPDLSTDALEGDKYASVDEDVTKSIGLASALNGGSSGTYAAAKLNLDIFYRRLGELLENIEDQVYNKLFKIILPKSVGSDYYMEYEKTYPLTVQEKADYFKGLVDKGYSAKYLVDMLGVDFNEYVEQSVYEIEKLKLREKIIPPQTSYTLSNNDTSKNGRPSENDSVNENTDNSNENGGNSLPDAGV